MGVQEAGFGAGQDGPLEDPHPTPPDSSPCCADYD